MTRTIITSAHLLNPPKPLPDMVLVLRNHSTNSLLIILTNSINKNRVLGTVKPDRVITQSNLPDPGLVLRDVETEAIEVSLVLLGPKREVELVPAPDQLDALVFLIGEFGGGARVEAGFCEGVHRDGVLEYGAVGFLEQEVGLKVVVYAGEPFVDGVVRCRLDLLVISLGCGAGVEIEVVSDWNAAAPIHFGVTDRGDTAVVVRTVFGIDPEGFVVTFDLNSILEGVGLDLQAHLGRFDLISEIWL